MAMLQSGPTSRITVRDASPADWPTIVDFNCRLAWETEDKRLDGATIERGVKLALAKPEYCRYFVAEVEQRVIGQTMITYEWTDWRAGVLWWIQSVYVAAEHRQRGVFRALFEHVRRQAEASPDVRGLRLYVEEHNTAAQATYRQLGLAPSGHLLYELDWSK
jgi:ribosomal protein S18 acetylase RimI-like enzyme